MDLLGTNRKNSKFQSSLLFLGTAAISGILFNLLFFQFYNTNHPSLAVSETVVQTEKCELPNQPLVSPLQWQPLEDKNLDELRAMVAKTKGYYARDWSLGLGWNNMRYIVEAALQHAELLNRTLVLPSFVYARACQFDLHVCAGFARMVNRGDAVGWGEWKKLPVEHQTGWRIPMEVMLDIPHLRSTHPVVLVSEYLQLQGLPVKQELASGAWDTSRYHSGPKRPTLHIIKNGEYDPSPVVRVDSYVPKESRSTSVFGLRGDQMMTLRLQQSNAKTLSLSDARVILSSIQQLSNDTALFEAIEDAGWTVVHTWDGALGMDYVKWVVHPQIEVAPIKNVRGFVQQFGNLTQDVVVLKGEIHLGRKPAGMRFTTIEPARRFATTVLRDLRSTPAVRNLALRLIDRIDSINDGRLWLAAHMRRGDFVQHGWAMEGTVEAHFERIQSRLKRGREIVEQLHRSTLKTYDVPFAQPNGHILNRHPPLENDAIYLATDETDPTAIEYLRNNSVILFKDILTIQDRREFGWPLLFTDVAALVEQSIMGIGASYFYGHALSSVVGGVINIRANMGWDPATALID